MREKIAELLSAYCTIPASDDAELAMDSLSFIQFVEEFETAFDVRVLPSEAVPANFGSVAAIVSFVSRKRS